MLRPLFTLAAGLLTSPQSRTDKNSASTIKLEIPASPPLFGFTTEPGPQLPEGCEDYRLVTGDIDEARIFLLGEHHLKCKQAREKCSQGLLDWLMPNGIDPAQTTLLFENYGGDERLTCADMGKEFGELSTDCRGWNLPRKQRKHEWLQIKIEILQHFSTQLDREFRVLSRASLSVQRQVAANYVQQWVDHLSKGVNDNKNEWNAFIEENGTNTSASQQRPLRAKLKRIKVAEKYLQQIHHQVVAGEALPSIVSDLNNKIRRYIMRASRFLQDPEQSIRKPNKAMTQAIRETSREKMTLVYAGRAHVDPTFHAVNEKDAANRRMMIAQLYGELVDVNPFAVLSCKLT